VPRASAASSCVDEHGLARRFSAASFYARAQTAPTRERRELHERSDSGDSAIALPSRVPTVSVEPAKDVTPPQSPRARLALPRLAGLPGQEARATMQSSSTEPTRLCVVPVPTRSVRKIRNFPSVESVSSMDRRVSFVKKATTADLSPRAVDRKVSFLSWALKYAGKGDQSWLEWLDDMWDTLGRVEAPPRLGWLQTVINSRLFSFIINSVIIANCFAMIYSVDFEISSGGHIPVWVMSAEITFLVFYALEFLIKISYYRSYYFYDINWKLNVFDMFLLFASLWNVIDVVGSDMNISWLRTVRLLRVVRVLRLVRVFSLVKPLRDISRGLRSTMVTLFWSIVMLFFILLMFSIAFVQRMATFFEEQGDGVDPTLRGQILALFPSVGRSMITLFMASSSGQDWVEHYLVLEQTGDLNKIAFVIYIAFIQIAVMNIILGVFIDRAMKNMSSEGAEMGREHMEEEMQREADLRDLCCEADLDDSGSISKEEWDTIGHKKMISYLNMLGLKPSDVQEFFSMMSSAAPDGKVNIDDFVRGCMQLKGNASCFDMQAMRFELQALRENIRRNQRQMRRLLGEDDEFESVCFDDGASDRATTVGDYVD